MTFAQLMEQQGVKRDISHLRQHAKQMLQQGIDHAAIENITGLSTEEIRQLRAESFQ